MQKIKKEFKKYWDTFNELEGTSKIFYVVFPIGILYCFIYLLIEVGLPVMVMILFISELVMELFPKKENNMMVNLLSGVRVRAIIENIIIWSLRACKFGFFDITDFVVSVNGLCLIVQLPVQLDEQQQKELRIMLRQRISSIEGVDKRFVRDNRMVEVSSELICINCSLMKNL